MFLSITKIIKVTLLSVITGLILQYGFDFIQALEIQYEWIDIQFAILALLALAQINLIFKIISDRIYDNFESLKTIIKEKDIDIDIDNDNDIDININLNKEKEKIKSSKNSLLITSSNFNNESDFFNDDSLKDYSIILDENASGNSKTNNNEEMKLNNFIKNIENKLGKIINKTT